VTTKNSKRV